MTLLNSFQKTLMVALTATAFTTLLPAASALAKDGAYTVKTTTNDKVRLGVMAFDKGDFEKSIRLNKSALESNMSPKKSGIAYSNLCAGYAAMDKVEEARKACAKSLELRPGYKAAVSNMAALSAPKT